jgi:general secretion pathway protein D
LAAAAAVAAVVWEPLRNLHKRKNKIMKATLKMVGTPGCGVTARTARGISAVDRAIANVRRAAFSVILTLMAFAAMQLCAQQRPGGGGGFGGGFGGFGGGFGGFGGINRGGFGNSGATTGTEYNNNGTVGNATIYVDPDTHMVEVIADAQTALQISNVIANMDHPKPQVLIKTVFLEVSLDNAEALGVQGSYTPQESWFSQLTGFMTNSLTPSGTNQVPLLTPVRQTFNVNNGFGLPQTLAGATGNAGVYSVLGSDFTATIQAIAVAGKAQIVSRPSILARDGQPATILVGQQVPLVTGISYETVGANTVPINNVTYTPVGLQVNVTPFISPDNFVEMIVTPQDSEVDPTQTEPIGGGVNAPVIDTRSADTVVVTPDGQTVVIGGLMKNDKESSSTKIPLLGDIPILGALFRYKSNSDDKNELMIFMTPHIVRAPMELASAVNAPNLTSGFITNSVSEQQLDKFLENIPEKQGTKHWH